MTEYTGEPEYQKLFYEFKDLAKSDSNEAEQIAVSCFLSVIKEFNIATLVQIYQDQVQSQGNQTVAKEKLNKWMLNLFRTLALTKYKIRYEHWEHDEDTVMSLLDQCFQSEFINIFTTTLILDSLRIMGFHGNLPPSIFPKLVNLFDSDSINPQVGQAPQQIFPSYIALTIKFFRDCDYVWILPPENPEDENLENIDELTQLKHRAQEALISALDRILADFDGEKTSSILYDLADMKYLRNQRPHTFQWDNLSYRFHGSMNYVDLRQKMLQAVIRNLDPEVPDDEEYPQHRQLSKILRALGMMKIPLYWNVQGDDEITENVLRVTLLQALHRNLPISNSRSLWNSLKGFAQMGFEWNTDAFWFFPSPTNGNLLLDLRPCLLQAVHRLNPDHDNTAISHILWAFAKMGARWNNNSDWLRTLKDENDNIMLDVVADIRPGMLQALYRSHAGFYQNEDQDEDISWAYAGFNMGQTENTLWALAELGFKWDIDEFWLCPLQDENGNTLLDVNGNIQTVDGIRPRLLQSVYRHQADFDAQYISSIFWSLARMNFTWQINKYWLFTLQAENPENIEITHDIRPGILQTAYERCADFDATRTYKIVKAFRELGFKWNIDEFWLYPLQDENVNTVFDIRPLLLEAVRRDRIAFSAKQSESIVWSFRVIGYEGNPLQP